MKFLGIILTVLVANCAAECDEGWTSFDNNCFKSFGEKKSWNDANTSCAGNEAYLAKIGSKDENNFILNTFLQIPEDEVNREAWIGLTDKEEEGSFQWADGTSPSYTNWADEQPNDEDDEQDCTEIANGVFWPGGEPQIGVWNDFQCHNALMYICEKDDD
ncbi:alpha-N-acetylgalactosamine-specific lectin-like isoform X2 [Oculina patagonica]